MLSTDIFCKVIDNFGDIGVCWRLAKQLLQRGHGPVRLWVDDLNRFARIEAGLDPALSVQNVSGIEIVHWTTPLADLTPHHLVIEAFGCDIPEPFISRMQQRSSLWINLEYLSAESWTEQWHGLPSLQPQGLNKFFFFPGFSPASGGLLREPDLLQTRDDWLAEPARRWKQLNALGLPEQALVALQNGALQVFVFCYGYAPFQALVNSLARQNRPTIIMVPQGIVPSPASFSTDKLQVVEIPFVSQSGFDRLLWGSDLNFVRGEDSLVRAIWAGRPMIWQIYAQPEQAHLVKLDAWLERTPAKGVLSPITHAWNAGDSAGFTRLLDVWLEPGRWSEWQRVSHTWAQALSCQSDLVTRLAAFAHEQAAKELK